MGSMTAWLRRNAEHYLIRDSQARIARKYGYPGPTTKGSFFWTVIFVAVYRLIPWAIRKVVMKAIPGSHTRKWSKQILPEGPAI